MEKSSFPENKRVARIRIIMDREHLKQKDLADALNMEPQNFSRIMISGKVSEKTCRKIIELYPEYRLEWLMGYDDSPTFTDWIEAKHHMSDVIADGIWGMIEKSLSKQGKSLRFVHRQGEHIRAYQRARADCHYTIVDQAGTVLKTLTAADLIQLEKQLQDHCDFLMYKLLS